MGAAQAPVNYVRDTDNLVLLLIGIFIGLALALFVVPVLMPRFAPFIRAGVPCNRLAAPEGGSNRSMLSFKNESPPNLNLDLILEDRTITQGQPLEFQVVFNNDDQGPVVLFMPQTEDLILNSGAPVGVSVEVRNIVTGQGLLFGIPGGSVPAFNQPYRDSEIHLVEGRTRCSQKYTIDITALPPGEYSVFASYSNTSEGILLPEEISDPAIRTQGVWASTRPIESPEIRFRIEPPATPTPPPI
jgi:hypothetical protein